MSANAQYEAEIEPIPGGQRIRVADRQGTLTFARYLQILASDEEFRNWYTNLLIQTGPDGFFWEHPPMTEEALGDEVEFVLIQSLFLSSLEADRSAFEEHFRANPEKAVIAFDNLGGDALLVVPTPLGPDEAYPHFASFLRHAPAEQIHALWQETALQAGNVIGKSPRWLSTAGLGVTWVHLRLDTRPKYYRYEPYKKQLRFDPDKK